MHESRVGIDLCLGQVWYLEAALWSPYLEWIFLLVEPEKMLFLFAEGLAAHRCLSSNKIIDHLFGH
jgi:hypothetical protein